MRRAWLIAVREIKAYAGTLSFWLSLVAGPVLMVLAALLSGPMMSAERARREGRRPLAIVAGWGSANDAHHVTAPDPEGRGVARAMRLALSDAGLEPTDIDWISAHGTSTPLNDPIETKAIKSAFGSHAAALKVSSLKSMTGHCIGAAGAIESIAGILGMNENFVHATINLDNPDPECDLDYVPHTGITMPIRAFVKNSMGFGGQNAVVIFKKP